MNVFAYFVNCALKVRIDFKIVAYIQLVKILTNMFKGYHLIFYHQVMGARHLVKGSRGMVSPFVEAEIIGCEYDENKYKTKVKGTRKTSYMIEPI